MNNFIEDAVFEFRRHKRLADRAMAQLDDEMFFKRPAQTINPIALIVKHLAGNLSSRWTDLLSSDGDKPARDREAEFVLGEADTRENLLAVWERGWKALFDTLESLREPDLDKSITIRGEAHTVRQAILRGMTHAAYHTGQILMLSRWLKPDGTWLTIPPGESGRGRGTYRSEKSA
jgi:uncharacterized damage-inducible protein DinB